MRNLSDVTQMVKDSISRLSNITWIEQRKAVRSGLPLWTALGSMFMPVGIAFLLYVAKNPEISRKLGLISVKADLFAYSAADWQTYLGMYGQLIAAGGFFLFVLVISWIFGREFSDRTIKDLLAVPTGRGTILLAKFIVASLWCAGLTVVILLAGFLLGLAIRLPDASTRVILDGALRVILTACLTLLSTLPFAFFASAGRGYLLPLGAAVLFLMAANLAIVLGFGPLFPWAIPGLFTMDRTALTGLSYWILIGTGLAGMLATWLWWKYADQA